MVLLYDQRATSSSKMTIGSKFERGFLLIEATIALAIVSIALMVLISLVPIGLRLSCNERYESRAIVIAQNLYNELTAQLIKVDLTIDEIYYLIYDSHGVLIGPAASAEAISSGLYIVTVVISPKRDQPGLSQVEITVSVPASSPRDKRINFNFVSAIASCLESGT